MSRKILLTGVAAVALAGSTWSSVAFAAGEISVGWANSTSAGTTITYLSNEVQASPPIAIFGIGTDNASWNQSVSVPTNLGTASVSTVGTANSSPFLASPGVFNSNTQDTLQVQVNCPVAGCKGSIALVVTASDMTFPASGFTHWQTSFTVNGNDSATFTDTKSVHIDESDGGLTTEYANVGDVTALSTIAGPNAGTGTFDTNSSISTPYSITELFLISFTGSGNLNDTISVNAELPEPASLSLLGGGLLAFGAWRRRRQAKA